jgi:hypothetical protein
MLTVSGVIADKPPKPPKPDKEPSLTTECIVFTPDFESVATLGSGGETIISGCCPNAGPSPEYTMVFFDMCYGAGADECLPDGPIVGRLFINSLGTGPNQQYIFQFWTWDNEQFRPGAGDFFVEIRGGVIVRDRKAKTETVTFSNETATVWLYFDENSSCFPFDDPDCPPCAGGVEPLCEPWNVANCHFPCCVEVTVPGVGFELFRSSRVQYCD